jgi:hypothetical protein
MARQWVENIRAVCQDQNVAFFFKQWGGRHKGRNVACLVAGRGTNIRQPWPWSCSWLLRGLRDDSPILALPQLVPPSPSTGLLACPSSS